VVAFAAPGSGQVAFVAGRKVGRAVQRNRARRLLRSAWSDLSVGTRSGMDVVLVARKAILDAKSHQVSGEIVELLRKAGVAPS